NVQRDLVKEESHASARDGAAGLRRQEYEPQARRKIILPADFIPIKTQTCIQRKAAIHFPFILNEPRIFVLSLGQHAAADKIYELITRSVRPQYRHGLADIRALKRSVAIVETRLQ